MPPMAVDGVTGRKDGSVSGAGGLSRAAVSDSRPIPRLSLPSNLPANPDFIDYSSHYLPFPPPDSADLHAVPTPISSHPPSARPFPHHPDTAYPHPHPLHPFDSHTAPYVADGRHPALSGIKQEWASPPAHPAHQDVQDRVGPRIMVYPPPPPPPPGERYDSTAGPTNERCHNVSLPSMQAWAPPGFPPTSVRGIYPSHINDPSTLPYYHPPPMAVPDRMTPPLDPLLASQRGHIDVKPGRKRNRASGGGSRHPSVEVEEAGLALAGMGYGLSAGEMRARRDSIGASGEASLSNGGKKVKVEREERKRGEPGKKSCSECRRLKAKCDRVFPCSNYGDLSCMQGKRLVLASTEQLHERVAQLESALTLAHSQVSAAPHPLLAPEFLDGGFASVGVNGQTPPLENKTTRTPPSVSAVHQPAQVNGSRSPRHRSSATSYTLHTPRLSRDNSASQGRMAVESLLLSEDSAASEGKREDEWVGENAAPAMIVGAVGNAPNDDQTERPRMVERLRKILRILPPQAQTLRQADRFWETSGWYQNILQREEFGAIYLPSVYAPTPNNPLTPHKLACVLMVLALDTYFDVTAPDELSPAVAEYWEGAQKCFDTRFGWAASIAGVQALALATLFVGFGWRGALASNFYWLRLMTSGALQIGLHKEPHVSLPEEERDFRRRVFHEMYALDCLMSINHGQRTAIPQSMVETAYPKTLTAQATAKYEYMKLVKNHVIEIGCMPDSAPASANVVDQTRSNLMQFDASKTPAMHCPTLSGAPLPLPSDDPAHLDSIELTRITASMCHYKALLFLYRPSLRRLIARLRTRTGGEGALSGEEIQTVAMTNFACRSIIACSLYFTRTHPRIAARCWAVWVQTFSAAVSIAALAIWCGPFQNAAFVTGAHQELSRACDMIMENGSKRALGVQSLLPILRNLVVSRYSHLEPRVTVPAEANVEGEDMLFLLLGGQVEAKTAKPTEDRSSAMSGATHATQSASAPATKPSATTSPPTDPSAQHSTLPTQNSVSMPVSASYLLSGPPQTWDEAAIPTPHAQPWIAQPPLVPIANALGFPPATYYPGEAYLTYQEHGLLGQDLRDGLLPGDGEDYGQMNATELWARLQTFYEPAGAFWQGGGEWQAGVGMELGRY